MYYCKEVHKVSQHTLGTTKRFLKHVDLFEWFYTYVIVKLIKILISFFNPNLSFPKQDELNNISAQGVVHPVT